MMKSFFKKLAFVMALAMVVSLAAPAGTALAANPLRVVNQDTNKVVKELTLAKVGDSQDLKYWDYFGETPWNKVPNIWESSNENVFTVDNVGLVTAVGEGEATLTITVGDYVGSIPVIVGEKVVTVAPTATTAPTVAPTATEAPTATPEPTATEAPTATPSPEPTATATPSPVPTATPIPTMAPKQTTAWDVKVTFGQDHNFNVKGEEGLVEKDLTVDKSVKLYRVFSATEVASMGSGAFDFMDAEGNGYQAHYLQKVAGSGKVWTLTGYNTFKHEAKYAVVYGSNDTSSDIAADSEIVFFTAYIGKVDYIVVSATTATIENEIEPAIPAKLSTKLYNEQDVDLTSYYGNATETEYELANEDTDLDVSVSGDEVTFGEIGEVLVKGMYTYYDEDLEDDVTREAYTKVEAGKRSDYAITEICAWTLVGEGKGPDWSKINHKMIAGDAGQLYVIVKDNRNNYYTNYVEGANENPTKYAGKDVYVVGDDDDTLFEQYGWELSFDSLDPDSLLVDLEGTVESYKKTKSFAVVSYRNIEVENPKDIEIGVMGIEVTEPRRLDSVKFTNGTSFTILKETEAETVDGVVRDDYYGFGSETGEPYADFKLSATLKVEFLNQYKEAWGSNAEDYYDVEPEFTVTTTKKAFTTVAENIADDLNRQGYFTITAASVFAAEDAGTSVTFKVKESATGSSTNVTIKLNEPKYNEDGSVYVDPSRAILATADTVELYTDIETNVKLFQVSKANQKIGYFRIGTLENNDEFTLGEKDTQVPRSYFVANELTDGFTVEANAIPQFVSTASGSALEKGGDVKDNDYILVVTDPYGRVFPTVGEGGNGKAFGQNSNLGIVASEDGTAYELVLAAYDKNGEIEYAAPGSYRVTLYKVTSIVESSNGKTDTYKVTRVTSDSFTVKKTFKDIYFYHQETTKDTSVGSFDGCTDPLDTDILTAIAETMTFSINGVKFTPNEAGYAQYKDYIKGKEMCDIQIIGVDYKVQNDGNRAVISTVTFKVETYAGAKNSGEFYTTKVKVNRSVNVSAE